MILHYDHHVHSLHTRATKIRVCTNHSNLFFSFDRERLMDLSGQLGVCLRDRSMILRWSTTPAGTMLWATIMYVVGSEHALSNIPALTEWNASAP
jgi:hypothetical protein